MPVKSGSRLRPFHVCDPWPVVPDQEPRVSGFSVLGDVCFLVDLAFAS
jgi:hypothetical protein